MTWPHALVAVTAMLLVAFIVAACVYAATRTTESGPSVADELVRLHESRRERTWFVETGCPECGWPVKHDKKKRQVAP